MSEGRRCAKMVFESRGEAASHIRHAETQGKAGRQPSALRPYRCSECGKWHLTKQPKKKSAAIRKRLRKRKG